MSTIIYPSPIFGPVKSRRLGVSLGINLLPADGKVCTFDCIYCECGLNATRRAKSALPTRDEVYTALEKKLIEMGDSGVLPDVLTFAGNGEPTVHPHFSEIIDDTIRLRNRLCPGAKVSVLTNATLITRDNVFEALKRVDNNILKLDSAFDATVQLMNKPQGGYTVERTVELLKAFEGKLIVQTMFLRGEYLGQRVDNTTNEEVEAWLKLVADIAPKQVMVYSLDRDTPCQTLETVEKEELREIAARVEALGISCSVA